MNVRIMAMCGLLISLSVILSRFASLRFSLGGIENIRFGLGTFPIMLSGVLFGPFLGGIVGIAADLLGMVVSPIGPYMWQFTFVSMLYGFIPGLFCIPFSFSSYKTQLYYRMRLYLGVFLGQFIPQLIFLPYFQFILFKIPYKASFLPRLITVPVQFLISLLLMSVLLNVLEEPLSRK